MSMLRNASPLLVCSVLALISVATLVPGKVAAGEVEAVPVVSFLDSIGVNTSFPDRGQPFDKTVEMLNYCGFRWVRGGIEGLSENGPTTLQTYLDLHQQTGVRFSWGLGSGGTDIEKLVATAKIIATAGALLAIEGNNEPNNWGVTYQGEEGGGKNPSWLAVAKLQRDLYTTVKAEPSLAKYPVWSISEPGAQRDNVGLQFLAIPYDAQTLMPSGTQYADFANVHNYIYHPNSPGLGDNKAWDAADPSATSVVDGLFGNFGRTWARRFPGYADESLASLPRVTTETGALVGGPVTERIHAVNLINMYLAQFKRGYAHTAVYLLRDRTDEEGDQGFGFFRADYKPRLAATYLSNLTRILADSGTDTMRQTLDYSIDDQPSTVHDLLLQRSDGTLLLVVWGERLEGEDRVTVKFGASQAHAEIYDPTVGIAAVERHTSVDAVELVLSDHPLVVVLPPPGR